MFSKARGAALAAVDRLHRDPYEAFSRPFFPLVNPEIKMGILRETAANAWADLQDFWMQKKPILRSRIPDGGGIDRGDQAIWHGVYSAIFGWAYACGHCPESELERVLMGLELHQPNISRMAHPDADGFGGILCRGIDEEGEPEWDASNDSASGHLLGLWVLGSLGPPKIKARATKVLMRWAENIYNHDGALINPDGKPTKFGKLENGLLTDPLRATLLMAIYGAAWNLTQHPIFRDAGLEAAKRHQGIIPYGKIRFGSKDNHNDTHRAAIHLRIMQDCGLYGDFRDEVLHGMIRLLPMGVNQANPWVMLLSYTGAVTEKPALSFSGHIIGLLSEWNVEYQKRNVEINNIDADGKHAFAFQNFNGQRWQSPVIEYGGKMVALQPLPAWARGSQDFIYQRHPFTVKDWPGRGTVGDTRHNSGAYLAPYWFARHLGIIDERN